MTIAYNVGAYCVAGLGALVKWPSGMTSATCCKIVHRDKTKLRNKNYNATLNPRNEICTLLQACAVSLNSFYCRLFVTILIENNFVFHSPGGLGLRANFHTKIGFYSVIPCIIIECTEIYPCFITHRLTPADKGCSIRPNKVTELPCSAC